MGHGSSSAIVQRALRALVGLVDDLTSGQRWTLTLMLGLAVVVLAFGLPPATQMSPVGSGSPAAAVAPADPGPTTTSVQASSDAGAGVGSPSVSSAPRLPAGSAAAPSARPGREPSPVTSDPSAAAAPGPAGPTTVVALFDPESSGPRGDEAIARHFLATAGSDAELVPIGDAFETCEAVGAASVVVASGAVPAGLWDCLDARGARIVSWDDARSDDAQLSTRRGAARSLLDTAASLAGDLGGRTALVADDRLRAVLEPVLDEAAEAGLEIDEAVWLEQDADVAGVGVDLAGSGTEAVIFATTVARQSVVASQLGLFSPGVSFVVLDAADAVVDAGYPLAMDGARAVTSVQFPWHPGARSIRDDCQQSWEQAQVPPFVLGTDELLRALQWCQHVELAMELAALDDPADDMPPFQGPRKSPVTSVLDVLPDGGYGPSLVAEATWSAVCRCWSTDGRFTEPGRP